MSVEEPIVREAITHITFPPYLYAYTDTMVHVRIKTKRQNIVRVTLIWDDPYHHPSNARQKLEMNKVATDELFDYWQAGIEVPFRRVNYFFAIEGHNNQITHLTEDGFFDSEVQWGHFRFPYVATRDTFKAPDWVKETVWYQILPDRFENGDPSINPPNTQPWGGIPTTESIFGGDLQGIINHVDYLKDLGVNGVYLTPLFKAKSFHKYDTIDYFEIDPQFGDKTTFKKLVDELHKAGIKIMLDCVFNHTGEYFEAFQDVVKNGENSKFKDWYFVNSFPIVREPEPSYFTFAWYPHMPKINTGNPEAKKYLLDFAQYWIKEFDIDGWRCDVGNEVEHEFIREFRKAVKSVKPECFVIAEIWHNAMPFLMGEQYDSSMNYAFLSPCQDLIFRTISATRFAEKVSGLLQRYPDNVNYHMFTVLSTHDVERVMTRFHSNPEMVKVIYTFAFTVPGTPSIYYGDEIGMTGFDDPDCRKCMEWDKSKQNLDLRVYMQRLIKARKTLEGLKEGAFSFVAVHDDLGYVVYQRKTKQQLITIVLHVGHNELHLPLADISLKFDEKVRMYDAISDDNITTDAVHLFPMSTKIIVSQSSQEEPLTASEEKHPDTTNPKLVPEPVPKSSNTSTVPHPTVDHPIPDPDLHPHANVVVTNNKEQ